MRLCIAHRTAQHKGAWARTRRPFLSLKSRERSPSLSSISHSLHQSLTPQRFSLFSVRAFRQVPDAKLFQLVVERAQGQTEALGQLGSAQGRVRSELLFEVIPLELTYRVRQGNEVRLSVGGWRQGAWRSRRRGG